MVDQLGHQPVPAPVHDAAPRPVLDQSETSIVSIHQSELTLTRLRAKSKLRSAENLRMRSTQKPEQHLNLVELGFRFSSVMLTPTGARGHSSSQHRDYFVFCPYIHIQKFLLKSPHQTSFIEAVEFKIVKIIWPAFQSCEAIQLN